IFAGVGDPLGDADALGLVPGDALEPGEPLGEALAPPEAVAPGCVVRGGAVGAGVGRDVGTPSWPDSPGESHAAASRSAVMKRTARTLIERIPGRERSCYPATA